MTEGIEAIGARGTNDVRVGPCEEDIDDAREKALHARLRDNRQPLSNAEWQATNSELVAIRRRRETRAHAATKRKAGIAAFRSLLAPPRTEVERLAALQAELVRTSREAAAPRTAWPSRVDGPPTAKTTLPLGVVPSDMTTPVEMLTREQVIRQIDETTTLVRSGVRVPDALSAAAAKRLGDLRRRLAFLDATRPPACDGATPTYVDGASPPRALTADRLIDLAESKGARFSEAEKQLLRTRFEEWKRAHCEATGTDPTSYEIRQDPTRSSFDGGKRGGVTIADRDADLSRRLAIIACVANNPLAALALARSWVTNECPERA